MEELLEKYIRWVKKEESCDFIKYRAQSETPFTDEEWNILEKTSEKINQEE